MADKIRLLPEVVANQIAAGEVVNRPASVVKEMMENAIDAGARTVKVNFRDGGKDLIQIVDDGSGMSPIDARMAFDRHATSKITSVEDIYALDTFGFRGEALASIAAVAQVELRTRQEGDEVGTQTEINGGQFAGQTPVMCPVGAQFFVRNLFYNVPARRRFLDKSTTSAAQIKAEFQRVALCNPHIAFELYANDAPVYTLCADVAGGTYRRCGGTPYQAEPAGGRGRHLDRPHRGLYRPSGCRQAAQRRAVPLRQRTLISRVRTSRAPS